MQAEEIRDIMAGYNKLTVECRIMAKQYLDLAHSPDGYYGHVGEIKIMPNADTFYFEYHPSTSGRGGNGYLPMSLVINGGNGLREIVEEDMRKKIEEEERNTCKSCGHKKNNLILI